MKQFSEIVEIVKDIISNDSEMVGKKVLDRDVAQALHVSTACLATSKNRNVILFEEIALFCAKKRIALNSILFDQMPESLIDSTNTMYINRYKVSA